MPPAPPHRLSSIRALAFALTAASLLPGAARAAGPAASVTVDWPAFLARQDLVWRRPPTRWEEGAFLGNGLLGAMAFAPEPRRIDFQLGRSDVTDHQTGREPILARPRLPIGRFEVHTAGELTGAEARLSLWDAEWRATFRTGRGTLGVRSYVHAELPVLVIELAPTGGERAARVVFQPALAINERLLVRPVPLGEADLNPAPFVEERGPLRVSVQRRRAGGEWAVAWQEKALPGGRRLLLVSIADSFPDASTGPAARDEAARAVAAAAAQGPDRLRRSHQAYWHAYYPQSFLTVPHPRIESFYWIQMYKLASATRADRPAIDTMGPWYDRTPWPGVWWNLNIQLSYWPVYTANRLALGESLLAIVARNKANLRDNVPPALRADAMAVGRMGGPDAVSPVTYTGPRGPKNGAHELSNLIWVMHNVWLHWRHSLDESLRQRMIPLLAAAVGYVLHRLAPGPDGKLHLPEAVSPEFPATAPDTNYDLALLRWGLQTLLELQPADPRAARWRDTLARLTPYPVGETGYLIGRGQPLDRSHRHFSHLMMVYPLRLQTGATAADRALIERSLAHWIGFEGALQGYSFVGASAISSLLGKGDAAARYLDDLLSRFVKPNTMYREDGPVIETPLAAAQALHEMLLQSSGGVLRIFPAVPAAWPDAAFHDLRAEGAFLVSAVRRAGRTVLVRVESLAGQPAILHVGPDLAGAEVVAAPGRIPAVRQADGTWKLSLARGESVLLVAPGVPAAARAIAPLPRAPAAASPFGLP